MTDDDFEGICENYSGVHYVAMQDAVPFVAPEGQVALNTVVYVRGLGQSLRIVSVPGSDPAMFDYECGSHGLCDCTPPAIWYFVGVDLDGTVYTVHTLDGHEAIHLMRHPDHIFESDFDGSFTMCDKLVMVPPSEGIEMVMQECQDFLSEKGVPGLSDEGGLSYSEVTSTNVDDLISKFLEQKNEG